METNRKDWSEKELAIFEGVHRLLREGVDYAEMKVSAIAAAAGVGKGTVYEYFSSKEEILRSALHYGFDSWYEEAARLVGAADTFDEKVSLVLDGVTENAESWRALIQTREKPGISEMERREGGRRIAVLLEELYRAAVAEGIVAGERKQYAVQALIYILAGFVVVQVGGLAGHGGASDSGDATDSGDAAGGDASPECAACNGAAAGIIADRDNMLRMLRGALGA